MRARFAAAVGEYVQLVAQKLAEAEHPMSTRRAVQIARNIEAVAAVLPRAWRRRRRPKTPSTPALRHSAARRGVGEAGRRRATLLTAHRAAWEIARLEHARAEGDLPRARSGAPHRAGARADSHVARGARPGGHPTPLRRSTGRRDWPAAAVLVPRAVRSARTCRRRPSSRSQPTTRPRHRSGDVTVTVRRGGADWQRGILSQWLAALDLTTQARQGARQRRRRADADEHEFKPATTRAGVRPRGGCLARLGHDAAALRRAPRPAEGRVMTDVGLLHNMSVPPRSTVTGEPSVLPGSGSSSMAAG